MPLLPKSERFFMGEAVSKPLPWDLRSFFSPTDKHEFSRIIYFLL